MTEENKRTLRTAWRDVQIEIRVQPLRWGVIAEIEVEAIDPPRAPLPISETGYLSRFMPPEELPGDPVAVVLEALDEAAEEKAWPRHRQLDLF